MFPNQTVEDEIFHIFKVINSHKAQNDHKLNNEDVLNDETSPTFSKHTGYTPYD